MRDNLQLDTAEQYRLNWTEHAIQRAKEREVSIIKYAVFNSYEMHSDGDNCIRVKHQLFGKTLVLVLDPLDDNSAVVVTCYQDDRKSA